MNWIVGVSISAAKETVLITLLDVIPATAIFLIFGAAVQDTLGLIFLFEATVLMLIGVALEFSSYPSTRRLVALIERKKRALEEGQDVQNRAVFYTMTGAFFFFETVLLALVGR